MWQNLDGLRGTLLHWRKGIVAYGTPDGLELLLLVLVGNSWLDNIDLNAIESQRLGQGH